MPKAMEQALIKSAKRKGISGKHLDAYVYGTMRQTGWKPAREKNTGEAIHESEASSIGSDSSLSPDEEQDIEITVADPEDVAKPGGASDTGGTYRPRYKRIKLDKKLLQSLNWRY
jgi:hypothetical protein